MDAKEWTKKLEDIKRYNESDEVWQKLKEDIWKYGNEKKKNSGKYHKLNAVNKSRENLYFGCVRFWNSWYFKHCHKKHFDHYDDKDRLQQIYQNILLKGTEQNLYFDLKKDSAQFQYELDETKQSEPGKIWSYKNYIYEKDEEEQINITSTELHMSELWKLVEYKEKGDHEMYKKYAYPKIWRFEQEQLEQERLDKIKEMEKQNERDKQKNRTPKRMENIGKMERLREENEEIDHQ